MASNNTTAIESSSEVGAAGTRNFSILETQPIVGKVSTEPQPIVGRDSKAQPNGSASPEAQPNGSASTSGGRKKKGKKSKTKKGKTISLGAFQEATANAVTEAESPEHRTNGTDRDQSHSNHGQASGLDELEAFSSTFSAKPSSAKSREMFYLTEEQIATLRNGRPPDIAYFPDDKESWKNTSNLLSGMIVADMLSQESPDFEPSNVHLIRSLDRSTYSTLKAVLKTLLNLDVPDGQSIFLGDWNSDRPSNIHESNHNVKLSRFTAEYMTNHVCNMVLISATMNHVNAPESSKSLITLSVGHASIFYLR